MSAWNDKRVCGQKFLDGLSSRYIDIDNYSHIVGPFVRSCPAPAHDTGREDRLITIMPACSSVFIASFMISTLSDFIPARSPWQLSERYPSFPHMLTKV
ncbi:hypothetical protein [Novacetimonas hansenii]|uniref:hypothetical protein n=1 Tax=Novacetimonas hansenii TaxID=436 RepID=UPI0009501AE2|nr:hypothetical protein [Novacetimonas hansenii]